MKFPMEQTEIERFRALKRNELLARHVDAKMPMFTDEQKGFILEARWLDSAKHLFLTGSNVYLWTSLSEAHASEIANEQKSCVIFREDGVDKVMLYGSDGVSPCYLLDQILLAQPIDAFLNREKTQETEQSLFPLGFACKRFYYRPSCCSISSSAISVFRQEPVLSLAEVKRMLHESAYVYPNTLSRKDAERMAGSSNALVLRDSTSQAGAIAVTFCIEATGSFSHRLIDKSDFFRIDASMRTIEDILAAIKRSCQKPDAIISSPASSVVAEPV